MNAPPESARSGSAARSGMSCSPVILDTLNRIDALMAEKADREGRDSPEGPKPDGPTTQGDSPPGEGRAGSAGTRPAADPTATSPGTGTEPGQSAAGSVPRWPNPTLRAGPLLWLNRRGWAPEEYAALQSENRGLRNDSEALRAENRGLRNDSEALRAENRGLRNDSEALRAENQGLRQEVEVLKTELFDSQEREESWRMAYPLSPWTARWKMRMMP